jgi:transglutaminase-like putative cysteine protease
MDETMTPVPFSSAYLEATEFIDWDHPAILSQAAAIAADDCDALAIARRSFEFVRDQVLHSWDHKRNPVTCKASDVLRHRTGYCYAKSHLLAALLRANRIPAGLCYQRLAVESAGPPFCLHGLNAAYFEKYGWYRCDARGNKPGIDAQFTPPIERLAFPIAAEGEADLPQVWPQPLRSVLDTLLRSNTFDEVNHHLPDIDLLTTPGDTRRGKL